MFKSLIHIAIVTFLFQFSVEVICSPTASVGTAWAENQPAEIEVSDILNELSPLYLKLVRPVHFTDPEDNDLLIEPGTYEIEAGEGKQIWLIATGSRETLPLKAIMTTHEEMVEEPTLLSTSDEDGRFDLVLLLPDGNSFNAIGSYSGIRSRGMLLAPLSQTRVKIARQQTSPYIAKAPTTPASQPPPQPPPSANQPAPPPQTSPQEATQVIASISEPRLITWNYVRMNRPDTVALMLRDVQAGKLPAASVQGLANPTELSAMLKKDWNAEVIQMQAARAASNAQASGIRSRGTGTVLAAQRGTKYLNSGVMSAVKPQPYVDKFGSSAPYYRLPISPDSWDMKSHYIGQRHRRLFTFNAPVNGEINITLPKNSKLKVRSIETYTGTLPPPREVMSRFLESARLNANLWPDVDTKRTTSPWTVPVRTNQGVALTIEFSPTAIDAIPIGPYKDSFTVGLAGRSIKVPVQANIEGILYGIDAQFPDAAYTFQGKDFLITVPLKNKGETSEARIEAVEVPAGITIDPLKITLAKGAAKSVSLLARVSPAASTASDQYIRFYFVNGNQRWYWDMTFHVYGPWIQHYVDMKACFSGNDCLTVTNGLLELRSDGWWHWTGKVEGCKIIPAVKTSFVATVQFVNGGESKSGAGDCGALYFPFLKAREANDTYDVSGMEKSVSQGFSSMARQGRQAFLVWLKGRKEPNP